MILKMGIMYTLNSIGPITEPWGIPYFKDLSVKKYSLIFTVAVGESGAG